MHLYDQLRQQQIIPDAYDRWRAYRQTVTLWLMDQLPEGATVAIVGAGRCNDLNLYLLANHCQTITLIDQDSGAMEAAVSHYD